MDNIAFKRAKHFPEYKDKYHPEFIVEYAIANHFPEGFHNVSEGYEIISQELFDIELAKNNGLQAEFMSKRKEQKEQREKILSVVRLKQDAKEKQEIREYEEFLKWKKSKDKR